MHSLQLSWVAQETSEGICSVICAAVLVIRCFSCSILWIFFSCSVVWIFTIHIKGLGGLSQETVAPTACVNLSTYRGIVHQGSLEFVRNGVMHHLAEKQLGFIYHPFLIAAVEIFAAYQGRFRRADTTATLSFIVNNS